MKNSSSKNNIKDICPGCRDRNKKPLPVSCACKKVRYCSTRCQEDMFASHIKECEVEGIEDDITSTNKDSKQIVRGLCGLENMGNTCFMNTSLQCLSNCWELTNYFLSNKYKKDINLDNPIGTKGKMCKSYANVLQNLWYGINKDYKPRNFKLIIDTITKNFRGNEQQDAEEFLTFLIDSLHEDLNRVNKKKKNQISNEQSNNEEIQSQIEWYNFKKLNQSVLIDFFYGQFKSLIYCPNINCQTVSKSFEPFFCVSLPVETRNVEYEVVCFFLFYDLSIKPIKLQFSFNNDYELLALRNKIAKILHIHPFSFIIAKMDEQGLLAYIAVYNQLISTGSNLGEKDNRKPYFLFQIDPTIFYNPKNNSYITEENIKEFRTEDYKTVYKELEGDTSLKDLFNSKYKEKVDNPPKQNKKTYYETEENKEDFSNIYLENNYGLNDDFINVLVFVNMYTARDPYEVFGRTKEIIFPRIITFHKKETCKEIHLKVFNFFKPLFGFDIEFDEAFQKFETDNSKDTYGNHLKKDYPYRLRVVNIMKKERKKCLICGNEHSNNCLLPFSSKITLKNIIDQYPKNWKNETIDNTYYYLNEKQRKLVINRDFSLEITIFQEKREEIYDKLNDFERQEFKMLKNIKREGVILEDCFTNFMALEELDTTNEYYCEKCKTPQKAKKQLTICKVPHFLIIQLKRFINMKKSDIFVNYPINGLDMSKFVNYNPENFPMLYDLFAVACHSGQSDFGHYYAICKNVARDKWYLFEDSKVQPIGIDKIQNSEAYILFYRRRNLENIIDLESIYQSGFVNYAQMIRDLENNYIAINKIVNEK